MGLISKIEDKLSGNKDSNTDSSGNKLSKSGYDDATSSGSDPRRNPIASAADQNKGSTTFPGHGTSGTHGSSGIGSGSHGTSGMGSGVTSGMTGSSGRDAYSSQAAGYGNDPSSTGGAMPSSHDPSGYSSSGRGPREPMDPYSSRGQEAAARAGSGGYGGSTSQQDYGRSGIDDSDVARSRHGGVLNQSSGEYDPYSSSNTGSSAAGAGALGAAGGAGAAYAGSRSHGQSDTPIYDQQTSSSTTKPYGQDVSYMHRQGDSGMTDPSMQSRSGITGGSGLTSGSGYNDPTTTSSTGMGMGGSNMADPNIQSRSGMGSSTMGDPKMTTSTGGMGGSTGMGSGTTGLGGDSTTESGMPVHRKMGGAYEAGYKDAMEHMKAEMGRQ